MAEPTTTQTTIQEIRERRSVDYHRNAQSRWRMLTDIDFLLQEVDRIRNQEWTASRVIEWLDDENRKPAIHAFTEGNERQIAYRVERIAAELERLKAENDDLIAANIRKLLDDIKSRLLPEEAEQFQSLLMTGAQVWTKEIVRAIQRSDEDEALLDAFRDDPRYQKRK